MEDGNQNFSKYSQIEIEECLLSIDRQAFPKNYRALAEEIVLRKTSGLWNENQSAIGSAFQMRRAVVYLLWLLYIPAYLVLIALFRVLTHRDLPHSMGIVFCAVFIIVVSLAKWRFAKIKKFT